MLLSAFSNRYFSAARAYVGGESLWSKGQKDAVIHLMRYADGRDEEEFRAYERAIAVPLGDRQARLELTRARPDYDKAAAGLLVGGNHPDDIPGMIRLGSVWSRAYRQSITQYKIWSRGDD